MTIVVIYLFNGITALDAVGPFESLSRSREIDVKFVGRQAGPVRTGNGFLALAADYGIDDIQTADVLIVPGGNAAGLGEAIHDAGLHSWFRQLNAASLRTCAVCTGSLILGAAGILSGREVSTHWRARGDVARFGATYSPRRVTRDGKYLTSAGVSAGIDLGLTLCGELLGDDVASAIELSMQYDPAPPYGTGNAELHATPQRLRIIEEALR